MDSEELRWTEPNDPPGEGTLVGGALDPANVEADFEPGAKLGRYVVLARMGEGGMGVVYAAYDPQLDRRIALKLMHHRGLDDAQVERASQRMLAEAKAMAQLSHPNVIAVHDVGTLDGRVFIAMEFVDGVPLSQWMREPGRNWQQILDVFTKAGRGLEAAHTVGLVHRDFKPDNVLVGDDGRVRVLDFGLARRFDGSRDPSDRRDREAGTPAYMSPEQHLGKILDHRADQFSFCVALYEALYGELPFAAKTRLELALAVTDGRVGPAPKRASVPNWVRWALLRGLDPDPEGRWEDMASLLAELGRDPYRRVRAILLWSGAAAVLVGLVVSAVVLGMRARTTEEPVDDSSVQCTSAEREMAEIWDEHRAVAVRAAFAKVDAAWAAETASEVVAGLDAWTGEWVAIHRETCETYAFGKQSGTMLDRRMLCLDRQLAEVGQFVEVITGAEAESLARVSEGVRQLPELSQCGREAIQRQRLTPERSDEQQQVVEQIERDLFRAHSLEMTGAFADALERAKSAVTAASELDDQALVAQALLTQSQVVIASASPEAAAPLLEEAELAAERAGADELRGEILIELARLEAELGDADAAASRVREARAVLDRVEAGVVERAALEGVAARASVAGGQLERAEQQVRAAIASLAEIEPPPVELAALRATLGVVLRELGRYAKARSEFEAAQKLWVGSYGEQHPRIAEVRLELAKIDARQGRHEQALQGYDEAIAVFEQVFGQNGLDVAYASSAKAESLSELGRYEDALRQVQRARSIFRDQGDATMVELAKALDAEGVVRQRLGDLDKALSLHRQALTILERARGMRGFGHGDLTPVLEHLGEVLLALDRPVEARAHLDLARELLDQPGEGPGASKREHFARVYALAARAWAEGEGGDLELARELAVIAREQYLELQQADSIAAIDTWLTTVG